MSYKKKPTNTKGKDNSKKNYRPRNKTPEAKEIEKEVDKARNDRHMYFTDELLAEQVSNFSFNEYLGNGPIFDNGSGNIANVMTLDLNPSPGMLEGNQSEGINAIAMKTYAILSANNAKTTSYAPQDVSTLLLALGQVKAMIAYAKTVFGVIYTFNTRNRAFPRGIINALGVDANDLNSHVADSRMHLNAIINQVNSIPMFGEEQIQYLKKCVEVYSHIYSDGESPMAQYYIYRPLTTWIIDETASEDGTILKTIPAYGTNRKIEEFLDNVLQPMVTALLESSTFNFIYSDILRITGGSGLASETLLPADYIVLPEYNPMKLLQINNTVVTGTPSETAQDGTPSNDVYPVPNNNSLKYKPEFGSAGTFSSIPRLLNFPHSMGNPDVDQRVDATRYTVVTTQATEPYEAKIALPDYYVAMGAIMFFKGDQLIEYYTLPNFNCIKVPLASADEAKLIAALSQFESHPIVYLVDSTNLTKVVGVLGDVDFFTKVDYNYLHRVDDLTSMGLFTLRSN